MKKQKSAIVISHEKLCYFVKSKIKKAVAKT